MRLVAGCVLNQELRRVLFFPPFLWIILMDFILRNTGMAMGDHGIKWGEKILQDLDYADDLIILD